MRLLYLTSDLSDADLAHRALERHSPPGRVEACVSLRQVLAQLETLPVPDGVLVDTTPPAHDPLGALAQIRAAHPQTVLLALVRPGADSLAGEALVAGADDTLAKHKEFFGQVAGAVTRVLARRPAAVHAAGPHVLLVAGPDHPALDALAGLHVTPADERWWETPAEQTLAARPDVVVLTDATGATAVAAAAKALRDRTVTTPLVLIASDASAETRAIYERIGVAAVLAAGDEARLPDVVRAVAESSRLAGQVAVLRAKETRLRAIVESVPASVVLIASDGTVLAMNVAGLATIGARGVGDIVGRPVFTLCDAASAADLRTFVARVCQGTPGLARFAGRGVDGLARTFEVRAVPMAREQDTTVLLGVMRVAPPIPGVQTIPDAEGTPHLVAPPDADAIRAELAALRSTLSEERTTHADLRGQLEVAGQRESVQEAAWSAIQTELQRKLILQASLPDRQDEHNRTRGLLEQTVRERDQQLLSLGEILEGAEADRRRLEAELARWRSAAAVRDADRDAGHAALHESLAAARAQGDEASRALAEREQELAAAQVREQEVRQALAGQVAENAALRDSLAAVRAQGDEAGRALAERQQELADAQVREQEVRQALAEQVAEVAALNAAAEQQAREHLALADVRQQVARLQAAAATAEQQQRALDEAHDQIHRLRAALEEALGVQTDLQRTLREREAEVETLALEHDRAVARARELEAAVAAMADREHAARSEAESRAREGLEQQLAEAREQREQAELRLCALEAERREDTTATATAELDAARAEAASLMARVVAAEDRASAVEGLQAQVEDWRARHEAAQVELDALLSDLADARRRGDHAQHLAGELSSLRAAFERARADAERGGGHVAELTAALDSRSRAFEAAQAAREATERELVEALAQVAQVTAARDTSAAVVDRLSGELAAAKRERAEALARLAELADAQEQSATSRARLDEELDAARRDISALQLARNEAQAALAAEREARARVEALSATAAAARDEAVTALAERQAELTQLRDAAAAAAGELGAARQALSAIEQDRAGHGSLLDDLRDRVAALEADIAGRQAALEAAASSERALREAVAAAEASREEAERALASAREAQRAVLDDDHSLRAQIADLRAQAAEHRKVAAEIDGDRAALRERLGRADASTQLMASRQREAQELLERSVADLRARLADVEAAAAAERASLERALAARDSAFRRLAQSGVVGLATTSTSGALLRCNEALAAFCGYASADDLLGRAGETGLPLVTDWPGLLAVAAAASAPVTVETCLQRPDGGVTWLHASAVAIEAGASGRQIEWTVVDATDRYLRLRQQRQSRRLEVVRDLAVSAGGELIDALSAAPADVAAGLVPAPRAPGADARLRAREIAQQLVAFAQKQARPAHMVDLAEQVTNLRPTLGRLAGDDVALEVEASGRPLVVTADPAELDHWITSLTVVLRDALPAAGSLTISLAPRDLVLAAPADAPRVAPVASLTLRATGYGVRAVALPASIHDAVAQRGGVLRGGHDAIGASTLVEIHLPLVASLTGADVPFPLSVSARRPPGA